MCVGLCLDTRDPGLLPSFLSEFPLDIYNNHTVTNKGNLARDSRPRLGFDLVAEISVSVLWVVYKVTLGCACCTRKSLQNSQLGLLAHW